MNKSSALKLQPRWLGPYTVISTAPTFGSYRLAELDGAKLTGTFTGKRLKLLRLRKENPIPTERRPQQLLQPQVVDQRRSLSTRVNWPAEGRHPTVNIPRMHSNLANIPAIWDDSDVDMDDDGESEASL